MSPVSKRHVSHVTHVRRVGPELSPFFGQPRSGRPSNEFMTSHKSERDYGCISLLFSIAPLSGMSFLYDTNFFFCRNVTSCQKVAPMTRTLVSCFTITRTLWWRMQYTMPEFRHIKNGSGNLVMGRLNSVLKRSGQEFT